MTPDRLNLDQEELAKFCQRSHIRRLSLFGSVLRDDFHEGSDIDFLVEFEEGKTPGWGIVGMEDELARIVGRPVDLRTAGDLNRRFRQRVIGEAELQYVSR